MAQSFARKIGTEEWIPVTQFGKEFKTNPMTMEAMVTAMRLRFPDIEYKIVEEEDAN